jgi:hypothetical protein
MLRVDGPLVIAALLLMACAACGAGDAVSPDGVTARVPEGTWGGEGIALDVKDTTAAVEFDCAHGTLSGPLRLDSQHRFSVAGEFTRERGGPVRRDELPPAAATYTGRLDGDTLTLTVGVEGKEIGPYRLTKGRQPNIHKCR